MRKLLILFILISTAWLFAEERSTICLNMIVKNETKVIKRCLESVKPLIDYWVIVDTGSTDGTQQMIKEFMKDIPGELIERKWVDFAYNRNEALSLAKGKSDYIFFIDADDKLAIATDFKKQKLDKEGYYVNIKYSGMSYDRIQLIKSDAKWKWEGVVHEVLVSPTFFSSEFLKGVNMVIVGGGDRSHDPKKFKKDAKLLEKALIKDPNCARYRFYLAQSYKDAGMHKHAIKNYEKRVEMGGWDQEVFWSLYEIGLLQETLHMPEELVCKSYTKAFNYRPTRVEPLYRLCHYYRLKENYLMGYLVSSYGLNVKPSSDSLFVESWIYEYGLLLEHSICAYWIGRYEESYNGCVQLLSNPELPPHVRDCVEKNLRFAMDKLKRAS